VFSTNDGGDTWQRFDRKALGAEGKKQSFFAASNSALLVDAESGRLYMITGGGTTSVITLDLHFGDGTSRADPHMTVGETAGGFSLASRKEGSKLVIVAVGGDYKAPEKRIGTAAYWIGRWRSPLTLPSGYRSAVAYTAAGRTWITIGPNGTDISMDDGRNWRALKPWVGESPDADKNWNALSLPFAVGPNGRIGKLNRSVGVLR
jgi:photosystem II stability/assembly factor-like uncharacterized protein